MSPTLFPLSLSLSLAVSVKNSRFVFTLDSRPAVFGAPPAASCAATTDRSAPFFLSPFTPAAHRATRYSLTNRLIYGEYSLHLNKKIKKIKPTKKIQKTKKKITHTHKKEKLNLYIQYKCSSPKFWLVWLVCCFFYVVMLIFFFFHVVFKVCIYADPCTVYEQKQRWQRVRERMKKIQKQTKNETKNKKKNQNQGKTDVVYGYCRWRRRWSALSSHMFNLTCTVQ